MEKKRSVGVTVLGWLLIIFAIKKLLLLVFCDPTEICLLVWKNYLTSISLFLLPTFGLIAGIFVLRLKEWARKLTIILIVINIVLSFVNYISILNTNKLAEFNTIIEQAMNKATESTREEIKRLNKPEYQEEQLRKNKMVMDITAKAAKALPMTVYTMLFLLICFHGIIIFFLTRPKIKEQFR